MIAIVGDLKMVRVNATVLRNVSEYIDYALQNIPDEQLTNEMLNDVSKYKRMLIERAEFWDDGITRISVDIEPQMMKNLRIFVNYTLTNTTNDKLTVELLNNCSLFNAYFITHPELQ